MNNQLDREITIPSLLKFTLPSIIMMVIMSLYTVVDGTFVSRLLNTDAFSAVNIVYPLVSIIIALGTMFGTGAAAIVSIKLGEGKHQEARENTTFLVLFSLGLGIALSVITLIFLKKILFLLGANDAIYGYCYDYALPLVFFFPANILQILFQSLHIANGKPQLGLLVTILGGLTNVVLDYLFIAVFKMGIAGAAIATGLGCAIPAVHGLFHFAWNKKSMLYFVKPKWDLRLLARTASNGSSEMVSNLSGSITTFLFNIIMMHFIGQDGVAAIAIILYMDFVLIAVSLGYSMGAAPLISYNYGYGNKDKLKQIYRLSIAFNAATGIFMTAITILCSRQLASVFAVEGTFVYDLAVKGLGIYAFSYLFKGYNIFASAMFTAFSNGFVSALLSFMRTLIFLTLSLVGLSAIFGVNGVWYATPLAELLAFIVALFFVLKYASVYHYS